MIMYVVSMQHEVRTNLERGISQKREACDKIVKALIREMEEVEAITKQVDLEYEAEKKKDEEDDKAKMEEAERKYQAEIAKIKSKNAEFF